MKTRPSKISNIEKIGKTKYCLNYSDLTLPFIALDEKEGQFVINLIVFHLMIIF